MNDIARIETAIKEKAKLIRCTNWLVNQNYVSFWRNGPPMGKSTNHWKSSNHTSSNRGGWSMFHPPPKKNDLKPILNYSNSGQTWLYGSAWPNMGYAQRTFST